MPESTEDSTEHSADPAASQLAAYESRAEAAEARVRQLEAELIRARGWRTSALIAVVAVALLAIFMLGIVAFNAVDEGSAGGDASRAVQSSGGYAHRHQ